MFLLVMAHVFSKGGLIWTEVMGGRNIDTLHQASTLGQGQG